MTDEGFLRRWSRRKLVSRQGGEPEPEPLRDAALGDAAGAPALDEGHAPRTDAHEGVPACVAGAGTHAADGARNDAGSDAGADAASAPRLPTMDDVAALTPDSDYSGFVARGVDQAVRRSALKKLFADPHFNTMDRLDIYIDDYTKPSPVSEAMLASLGHARRLFERVADAAGEADAAPIDAPQQDEPIAPAAAAEPRHQQNPPETETR